MIIRTLLFLVALTWLGSRTAVAIDVYIVAGQSNGWRMSHLRAANAPPGQRRIHYFGMACVSEPDSSTLVTINPLDEKTMGYRAGRGAG